MENIEIEIYGNGKDVVLLLTGLGGNVKGYQNKYETMAKNIVKDYGFSVFIATTPQGSWEHSKENIDYIMNFIDSKIKSINPDYSVYVFGHSAGGTFALWYAYQYKKIKRLVAVNPVLNVNFHKLKNGIENFENEFIKVIIGDKDNGFQLSSLLKKLTNAETIILPNIDHEFKTSLETFIDLPKNYLLK